MTLPKKNELMIQFSAYWLLSEQIVKGAAEAAKNDPFLIILRNTLANRSELRSSVLAHIITGHNSDEDDSEELASRGTHFAEKCASNTKITGKKNVSLCDL